MRQTDFECEFEAAVPGLNGTTEDSGEYGKAWLTVNGPVFAVEGYIAVCFPLEPFAICPSYGADVLLYSIFKRLECLEREGIEIYRTRRA